MQKPIHILLKAILIFLVIIAAILGQINKDITQASQNPKGKIWGYIYINNRSVNRKNLYDLIGTQSIPMCADRLFLFFESCSDQTLSSPWYYMDNIETGSIVVSLKAWGEEYQCGTVRLWAGQSLRLDCNITLNNPSPPRITAPSNNGHVNSYVVVTWTRTSRDFNDKYQLHLTLPNGRTIQTGEIVNTSNNCNAYYCFYTFSNREPGSYAVKVELKNYLGSSYESSIRSESVYFTVNSSTLTASPPNGGQPPVTNLPPTSQGPIPTISPPVVPLTPTPVQPTIEYQGRLYWGQEVSGCVSSTSFDQWYFEVWNIGRDIWFDWRGDIIPPNGGYFNALPQGQGYYVIVSTTSTSETCYALTIRSTITTD